jgi:hypothetical protein
LVISVRVGVVSYRVWHVGARVWPHPRRGVRAGIALGVVSEVPAPCAVWGCCLLR